jgi:putative transposase
LWYWKNREQLKGSLNQLYEIAGISKQGFHKWLDNSLTQKQEQMNLTSIIYQIRSKHPKLGCREIYRMINPEFMGRDKFEEFCFSLDLRVKRNKNKFKTTQSNKDKKFSNLLNTLNELTDINQLWVSDITFFPIGSKVFYLTFILDVYNREIVGYAVSKTLKTEDTTIPSLLMAIKNRKIKENCNLIFHSDGGGQYYSKEFINITKYFNIKNSMCECVYQNSHAERINGTIKNDYLTSYNPKNHEELVRMTQKAIYFYNNERPHKSLRNMTPVKYRESLITRKWSINLKAFKPYKEILIPIIN